MPSALPTLVENLHTALEAAGIINSSAISVLKAPPAPEDAPGDEVVWFGDAAVRQEYSAQGPSYQEVGELEVIVRVRKPGGGETQQDSARDRAAAIWDVVTSVCLTNSTLTSSVLTARPASWSTSTIAEPGDTVCVLTGSVSWMAHITS